MLFLILFAVFSFFGAEQDQVVPDVDKQVYYSDLEEVATQTQPDDSPSPSPEPFRHESSDIQRVPSISDQEKKPS